MVEEDRCVLCNGGKVEDVKLALTGSTIQLSWLRMCKICANLAIVCIIDRKVTMLV